MKHPRSLPFATTVLPLAHVGYCPAQDWTGNIDSDWNNAGNWSQWPLDGEDVTIDPDNFTGAMLPPVVSSNAAFTPNRIGVENGAHLTISANLSVTDRMVVDGPSLVM